MKNDPSPLQNEEGEESRIPKLRSVRQLRIGLTGGIGSGKSTVASILSEFFPVIQADDVSKDILRSDVEIARRLAKRFGASILDKDQRVQEHVLADIVFHDAGALKFLNSVLHPPTRKRIAIEMEKLFLAGKNRVIIESALIFEAGIQDDFDVIIAVTAEPEVVKSRLLARGLSEAQIEARLSRQWDPRRKAALADFVITNNGDREALHTSVLGILILLRSMLRG